MKLNSTNKKVAAAKGKNGKEAAEPNEETLHEIPIGKIKNGRKNKGPGTVVGEISNPVEESGKISRLGLIKQRHEAMKREIDQIREDLESEEEE